MNWIYDDGGRADAFGGTKASGDCVCRAISIAANIPYRLVYDRLNEIAKRERIGKRKRTVSSARTGVHNYTIREFMKEIGWKWVPTMTIGSGCKVHLRKDELPSGRLVVAVSQHLVAVIDGVQFDIQDNSRDGTRCVYGYFIKE